MQWSALEKADPTDPTVLAKHLEALEKAKARCQERMADAVTKKLEQLSTSDEPRAGGAKHRGKSGQPRKAVLTPAAAASSSSGLEKPTATLEKEGKKKKSKPAQDLEKSKPKDLETCQGSTTHGSATKGLEKPVVVVDWHNTLEKDDVVSQDNLAGLKKLQSDPALCSGHCHKEKASPGGHGCHDPRPHSPAGSCGRNLLDEMW